MQYRETKIYKMDNPYDAVQAMMDTGEVKRTAVANAANMDKGTLSKTINNPDHAFHRSLRTAEMFMREAERYHLLFYWADLFGFEIREKESSVEEDTNPELAEYQAKKKNGELPNP
jgi:ribosomal 30S subunit maturation factor RimM